MRRSTASLLLGIAAVATAFPAYALLRWLWAWRQAHSVFREAVLIFETDFPFGLRGTAITLTSLGAAAVGALTAGLVLRGAHGVTRAVAYSILVSAATLVIWNLWTMM